VSGAHVRAFRDEDLPRLYEICLRTAAAGEDATDLVTDPRLFGEVYAAPYAALEPEHAFVLDDGDGQAVGYVLGALDTRDFEARCEASWWPALRARHPRAAAGDDMDGLLVGLIHGPHLAEEEVLREHPSHLHIDLLPEMQGGGWGRRLMARLHDSLTADGSTGVHLGVSTRNHRAIGFYHHLGYVELGADDVTRCLGLRL
jgi:ribosomal protein S18 acetylase RimI-like enzyme